MKKLSVVLFFFASFVTSAVAQAAVTINTNLPGQFSTSSGPVGIVANAYQFALLLAGMLAFAVIVYGAIKYTISGGNAGGQSDAKEWISQAFWGLLLLLGAYIILNTINPAITKLNIPQLSSVPVPTSTAPAPTPSGIPAFCARGHSINCVDMNQCRLAQWGATGDTCIPSQEVVNVEDCVRQKLSAPGLQITDTGGRHSYGSCHFGGSPTQAGCGKGRAIDIGVNSLNNNGGYTARQGYDAIIQCSPYLAQCYAEYGSPITRINNAPNIPGAFSDPNMAAPAINNAHIHCNITGGPQLCGCN